MVIQGYDRINWEDLPSQATPINAENLNHMEDGIENLYAAIGDIDLDAIADDIAEVKEEVENFKAGVELTQEEYDDLTEEEKNNGTVYYITDGDASAITAADAHYDNSTSGLTATNVQSAVDEVQGEIDVLNSNFAELAIDVPASTMVVLPESFNELCIAVVTPNRVLTRKVSRQEIIIALSLLSGWEKMMADYILQPGGNRWGAFANVCFRQSVSSPGRIETYLYETDEITGSTVTTVTSNSSMYVYYK